MGVNPGHVGGRKGRDGMRNLLSTKEVAQFLGVNEKMVYTLVAEKSLPATKITGKWLFPKHLVEQWVEANTINYPEPQRHLPPYEGLLIVAGSREDAGVLDSVLHAAAFQPLNIPESFNDNPDTLRAELTERRRELEQHQQQLHNQLDNWRASNRRELLRARQLLDAAEAYVNVRDAARSRGPLAVLQGWIPGNRLAAIEKELGDLGEEKQRLTAQWQAEREELAGELGPLEDEWTRRAAAS